MELYIKNRRIPFYKKQTRLVLEHCGHIDATSINEYLAYGGYRAVEKALFDMSALTILLQKLKALIYVDVEAEDSQQVENGDRLNARQLKRNILSVTVTRATLVHLWIEVLWKATHTECLKV